MHRRAWGLRRMPPRESRASYNATDRLFARAGIRPEHRNRHVHRVRVDMSDPLERVHRPSRDLGVHKCFRLLHESEGFFSRQTLVKPHHDCRVQDRGCKQPVGRGDMQK